jgi:hypothetical protein
MVRKETIAGRLGQRRWRFSTEAVADVREMKLVEMTDEQVDEFIPISTRRRIEQDPALDRREAFRLDEAADYRAASIFVVLSSHLAPQGG